MIPLLCRSSRYRAALGSGVLAAVLFVHAGPDGRAQAAILQAPQLAGPANNTTLPDFGPTLQWSNPIGVTQYHLQVAPANDDGPGIDLITAGAGTSFAIPAPPKWYGLLPGMGYTWRVRVADTLETLGGADGRWGPWPQSWAFRTPVVSSATITLAGPTDGALAPGLRPTLTWANTDTNVFYYELQMSRDPEFGPTSFLYSALLHGGVSTPINSYAVPQAFPLSPGALYYWRVRPRIQGDGQPAPWPAAGQFRTPDPGGPFLDLTGVADETVVQTPAVVLKGVTQPGLLDVADQSAQLQSKMTIVSVNGFMVPVDPAGAFSKSLDLSQGPNLIDVMVSDSAGNTVARSITLNYLTSTLLVQGGSGVFGEVTEVRDRVFFLRQRDGRVLGFSTDTNTKFSQPGRGLATLKLAEVKAGMRVAVLAHQQPSGTPEIPGVYAQLVQLPPARDRVAHRTGIVNQYTPSSVTLTDREGKAHTLVVTGNTRFMPPASSITVGNKVLAVSRWNDDQGQWQVETFVKLTK